MTRDDALAAFHRARRAYHAATDAYQRTGTQRYSPADPTALIAEHTASKTALAAATAAYDAAIDDLARTANAETRAQEAQRHWHRTAREYTANQSAHNYHRLNAAHDAYKRAATAAGLYPQPQEG